MEREGKAFWLRKDINARQSSMKWFKRKFLEGDEEAIHGFWMHQSYIIYWREQIPGGWKIGRFLKNRNKKPRIRAPRAPRVPRPPKVEAPPIVWTPQIDLDWS